MLYLSAQQTLLRSLLDLKSASCLDDLAPDLVASA